MTERRVSLHFWISFQAAYHAVVVHGRMHDAHSRLEVALVSLLLALVLRLTRYILGSLASKSNRALWTG